MNSARSFGSTPHSGSRLRRLRRILAAAFAGALLVGGLVDAASAQSSARRFPSIDLGSLTRAQQDQFLELVDSELCPCEGSLLTLGECLEVPNGTCALARHAVDRIQQGLSRNETSAQISHGIAQHMVAQRTPRHFDLRDVPWKGASTPKVTMVVFADFQCPFCRLFAQMADEMVERFPNELRVYALQYPLSSHPHAMSAAIASLAAHRQGKFWEFHDILFSAQQSLNQSTSPTFYYEMWAEELGLDLARFQRDCLDPQLAAQVSAQRSMAQAAGATGTPTVFLDGIRFGDLDHASLQARIEALIRHAAP